MHPTRSFAVLSASLIFVLTSGPSAVSAHCLHDLLPTVGQVTHRFSPPGGAATGIWASAGNWDPAEIPPNGAVVEIPAGKTVNVGNPMAARLAKVVVSGTLNFTSTGHGELQVDTLIIPLGGTLQMGTEATRIAPTGSARITIIDAAVPNDPERCRRGIVADGRVRMNGAQKTAFVALVGDALQGTTTVTLAEAPVGWQVGDEVVIPATKFTTSWSTDLTASDNPNLENEVRGISLINGTAITLDAPLAYNHRRPATTIQHFNYIANLTRNVVVESEVADISKRGHVMLMNNDSIIRNAAFLRLGRTDKRAIATDPGYQPDELVAGLGYTPTTNPRGRYALHFHKAGTDIGGIAAQVTGCVARDTPGWGFVNHASYVNFTDNVAFDFDGAGFVTENGDEAGSFVDNIAIGGIGNGMFPQQRTVFGNHERMNQGDMAFHGDGFWFQGPDLTVTGNVSAGNKGSGFTYWCAGRLDPTVPGGLDGHYTGFPRSRVPTGVSARGWSWSSDATRVLVSDIPIKVFSGNTAYANFTGVKFRFVNQNSVPVYDDTRSGYRDEIVPVSGQSKSIAVRRRQTVSDGLLWNNLNGLHATYIGLTDFRNITNVMAFNVVGDGGIGLAHNIAVEDITLTNMKVVHYLTGLWVDTVTVPTRTTYSATALTISGYDQDADAGGIHDGISQPVGFTELDQRAVGYPETYLVQPSSPRSSR